MPTTGLVLPDACIAHSQGHGHPERPERLVEIKRVLDDAKLPLIPIEAARAEMEDLRRIHTQHHIEVIEHTCREEAYYPDPDTQMITASWEAALLAAGGAIEACKAVMDGTVDNAFVAVRPPGHHAEKDRAMGFCLFNNVAVAAKWLQANTSVERVAIFDWDVHHGNGTQHAFYEDDTVYYASIHEHPLFPGTGSPRERGKGNTTLNIQMRYGTPGEAWVEAVKEQILPEFERFNPDFLLISAGFDAHHADPLGGQLLDESHFAEMTDLVKGLADGRAAALLEGGYDLRGLGQSVLAHVQALGKE